MSILTIQPTCCDLLSLIDNDSKSNLVFRQPFLSQNQNRATHHQKKDDEKKQIRLLYSGW